jgi:hypothetical protein
MKRLILRPSLYWLVLMVMVTNCIHDPLVNPENPGENPLPGCIADDKICFESSVLPIFVSSCAKPGCHDAQSHKEGYILDSYSNIVRKGIQPGSANNSKLYEVLFEDGEDRMPPSPDAPLTQAQKDSIKVWINQGANNTTDCNCYCDETQFTYAAIIQPLVNRNCVGCHKPGSLSGNLDLSTYTAVKVQVNNGKFLGSVTHTSGYSPMPPGGKLSDCEIAQITNWINAGALNN